jgi:putative NADH-flavin reductase
MRITVLGSTGRTGQHVLREGLRRGHEITAFTRRPEVLTNVPELAAVISGDGRDPHPVRQATAGADAVIAIVAASKRKGPHHTAAVSRVLTKAMNDNGVRRLTITSAYPIVADQPRLPMALLRLVFADAYTDAATMEQVITTSDLDWTIVRLNRLTDRPAQGGIRTSRDTLEHPSPMTRADTAALLLDLIVDGTAINAAINACGPARRR